MANLKPHPSLSPSVSLLLNDRHLVLEPLCLPVFLLSALICRYVSNPFHGLAFQDWSQYESAQIFLLLKLGRNRCVDSCHFTGSGWNIMIEETVSELWELVS